MASRSPLSYSISKPGISSPMLSSEVISEGLSGFHSLEAFNANTESTPIGRKSRTNRKAKTISQIFDINPLESLPTSPLVSGVFSSSDKKPLVATQTFINRHLRSKTSFSTISLRNTLSGSPTSINSNTLKLPGALKYGVAFNDLHLCLMAEYAFKETSPLAQNGRYLMRQGPMKLISKYSGRKSIIKLNSITYAFLFNDSLVLGTSANDKPENLTDQLVFSFFELSLDSNLVDENQFTLEYQGINYTFELPTRDELEQWVMVIQSGITFFCTMWQRKAKEEKMSQLPGRAPTISSVLSGRPSSPMYHSETVYAGRPSRRGSFYNTLKDLVGTFI